MMTDTSSNAPMDLLLLPGIHGSGPEHWQTRWQQQHAGVCCLAQRDWDQPRCDEWVATINAAVQAARAPLLLVAHSLGCLALAHWAAQQRTPADSGRPAHRLMMVAPPDPHGPAFPAAATGFESLPDHVSGHRLLIVSSENDPYASPAYTRGRVQAWGAEHVALGPLGHLNAASGLGDWPEGWALAMRWRDATGLA